MKFTLRHVTLETPVAVSKNRIPYLHQTLVYTPSRNDENAHVFSIYLHQFSTKGVGDHLVKLIIFVWIERSRYLTKVKWNVIINQSPGTAGMSVDTLILPL